MTTPMWSMNVTGISSQMKQNHHEGSKCHVNITAFCGSAFYSKMRLPRADLAFDFAVLLFNGDPCAWPYIEVAVMAWMTHRWTLGMPIKPCLMSWERASKEAKWPDMRDRLEPHNPWPGTSNSCVWFFFSFATFVSVSFRRGTKVQIFNVVGEHQWCAVRLFVSLYVTYTLCL